MIACCVLSLVLLAGVFVAQWFSLRAARAVLNEVRAIGQELRNRGG